MRRTGHDTLSTYGLLRAHSVAEIRGWIDQLVGHGHLLVSGDRYPVLVLSQTGVEVMKGERDVALYVWPERKASATRRARRETRVLDDPEVAALPVRPGAVRRAAQAAAASSRASAACRRT